MMDIKYSELSIPLVNVSDYLNNTDKRVELKDSVLDALSTHGFMYIQSANFSEEDIESCISENTEFFSRFSSEFLTKHAVNSSDSARRGYSATKSENFGILVGKAGIPNDTVEKFRFGPFHGQFSPSGQGDTSSFIDEYYTSNEAKFMHFIPNQLKCLVTCDGSEGSNSYSTPVEVQLFEESIIENYYNKFKTVACEILSVLQDCMELPDGYFDGKMDKHTSIMTFNSYKGEVGAASAALSDLERVRITEHTDISMLTLLIQSQPPPSAAAVGTASTRSSRLQVKTINPVSGDVEWRCVAFRPGGIIVNIGDCLSYWTHGKLKSTYHRVVDVDVDVGVSVGVSTDTRPVPGGQAGPVVAQDRFSVAYFVSPNYNSLLERNWPTFSACADTNTNTNSNTAGDAVTSEDSPITYSNWRKKRIKSAMKHLKSSTSATSGTTTTSASNRKVPCKG